MRHTIIRPRVHKNLSTSINLLPQTSILQPLKQLVMDYTDVMNITSSNMARAIWKYNLKTATSASRRNSVHKTFYTYIKAQVGVPTIQWDGV